MPARPSTRRHRATVTVAVTALATALSAAVVPAATAAPVSHLHGYKTPDASRAPHRLVGHATPDATFGCQTTTPASCYGPAQLRAAYGIDQLPQDGAGETITIIDAYQSPTIQNDLDHFDSLFGLPAATVEIIAPQGLTPFDQSDEVQVGWAGEISLDVEWAHAVAPAAHIQLVLAKTSNDDDIFAAEQYVAKQNKADVLSQSYGENESCVDPTILDAEHSLYRRLKVKNRTTVFASSADDGAANATCDGTSYVASVSSPASDPAVTAVGGTLLTANGTTGAYGSETTWNEPVYNAGGGGGYSVLYAKQNYQAQAEGRAATGRGVPDIAYNGGINTGVLTVWSTSGQGSNLVFRFGGTSAGSPQWAGIAALADQAAGHRIGFINKTLYTLAKSPTAYAADFHDVTTGDNTYYGDGITVPGFAAKAGWDPATGLGTPQVQNLVPALAAAPVVTS